jgi:dimethylargininase
MLALTHLPSPNMQACQRTFVPQAAIAHERTLAQHAAYCEALRACRVNVVTLNVNAQHPDSTFLEDTAIVLDEVAVLTSMGTPARREEPRGIEPILRQHREVVRIDPPAKIEGGDVLRVGRRLLVGSSTRTNFAGIALLAGQVEAFGYTVQAVPVQNCLHLKTGCTVLPDGRLLVNPAWINPAALTDFEIVEIPPDEPWAANICLVNSSVLLATEHVRTAELIDSLGFNVRPVELSEFAKAEGGVTCLSLLFNG